MAFRERVKRVLGRSSSSNSSNSSLSKKTTASTTPRDNNVYQPGEKMPPMKYRRPVQKEHKEKLESFQFSKAWRRRSDMSQYSPMGSRLPSRMNSMKSRQSMQVARGQFIEGPDEESSPANGAFKEQAAKLKWL